MCVGGGNKQCNNNLHKFKQEKYLHYSNWENKNMIRGLDIFALIIFGQTILQKKIRLI